METVLRPETLHAHSGAYEETNDIIYSENGENLYNNQIFLRWGNIGPAGPNQCILQSTVNTLIQFI